MSDKRPARAKTDTHTDDVPLALRAKQEQQLAKVVYEPGHLHPLRLAVPANSLGGLQQVLDLR